MLDVHLLKVFVAVYKHKSVTKAAEELFLSQPTVSEHIKTLEKFFGCQLFDRINRKLYPTHYAERLYEKAIAIIEGFEGLKNHITAQDIDFTGKVHLGASSIPSAYILPELIAKMKEAYNKLYFDVITTDSERIIEAVSNHEIPLGFVGTRISDPALEFTPFAKDRLVLIAGRDFAKKDKISVEELRDMPLVVRESGSGTLKEVLRLLEKSGITKEEINISASFGSNEAIKEAVIKGVGLSFVSSLSIKKELKCRILKTVEVDGLEIERFFYIVRHRDRTLPPLYQHIVNFILSHSKTLL